MKEARSKSVIADVLPSQCATDNPASNMQDRYSGVPLAADTSVHADIVDGGGWKKSK